MAEAAEIAKLRLFLKLAAQLDDPARIEPLPDLDFNIKSGNLLVGIADAADIERRFSDRGVLPFGLDLAMDAAESVAAAYDDFVAAQAAETGAEGEQHAKGLLQAKIKAISGQVDAALYEMRNESQDFEEWRKSHQPFHWFAEFPAVWRKGGFDVIIGNPPYIKGANLQSIKKQYSWQGFTTQSCPDIYAVCVERGLTLLNDNGRFAMIVMLSLCCGGEFEILRKYVVQHFSDLWISAYSRRPSELFIGSAAVRNTIIVGGCNSSSKNKYMAGMQRWTADLRPYIFSLLSYKVELRGIAGIQGRWMKLSSIEILDAFAHLALRHEKDCLQQDLVHSGHLLFYRTNALYFLSTFPEEPPAFDKVRNPDRQTKGANLYFNTREERDIAFLIFSGRWGFLWWVAVGNDMDVNKWCLESFPSRPSEFANDQQLLSLATALIDEAKKCLFWVKKAGRKMANYDLRQCRHITDEADWLLAQAWRLTWEQYEAAGNLRDRMTFGNRG